VSVAIPLHTIQDQPFALEERPGGGFGGKSLFPVLHGIAILFVGSKEGGGFLYPEYSFGYFHSRQYAVLLDLQHGLSPGFRGNAG
jgi:hypothetical protein